MIVTYQQTQNMFITFVQCSTNIEDVGPTLYKCYVNVLCYLASFILFVYRVYCLLLLFL